MSDKVMLRELREDDAERMLEWMHDDTVMRWLQFDGKSKTIEDARQFIFNAFNDTANMIPSTIKPTATIITNPIAS